MPTQRMKLSHKSADLFISLHQNGRLYFYHYHRRKAEVERHEMFWFSTTMQQMRLKKTLRLTKTIKTLIKAERME